MENTHSRNSASLVLALILFLSAGVLFRFAENDLSWLPQRFQEQSEIGHMHRHLQVSAQALEEQLNEHLRETNKAVESDRFHRTIDAHAALEGRGGDLQPIAKQADQPLQLEPLDSGVTGNGGPNNSGASVTPGNLIQEELAYRQFRERRLAQYRKEYIRQYVENARAQGWNVEVDAKGQVQRVTALPAHRPTIPFDDPVANSTP